MGSEMERRWSASRPVLTRYKVRLIERSFIGVGISPPTPSWGQMVGENQQFIRSYWYLCVFPAAGIATIMLAFTFLGDGLRDALDPKLNEQRKGQQDADRSRAGRAPGRALAYSWSGTSGVSEG